MPCVFLDSIWIFTLISSLMQLCLSEGVSTVDPRNCTVNPEQLKSPTAIQTCPTHEYCKESPLHVAVRRKDLNAVHDLIRFGADMYKFDCDCMTPFHVAILIDDQDILLIFIKFKFDVTSKFLKGNTVLHYAASNGSENTVANIVQSGCMVDVLNDDGVTPFFVAVKLNRTYVYQTLLKFGANIQITFPNGDSYLHMVARLGDVNLILFFIEHGIYLENVNRFGETALTIAVKNDNPVLINIFFAYGACFWRLLNNKQTYLHVAAMSGSLEALKVLLEHGKLIDATDINDDTALSLAIQRDDVRMVELLLSYGSDISKYVKSGMTYLHVAVLAKSLNSLRALLQDGLPVNSKSISGIEAIVSAVDCNFTEALDVLKAFGANVTIRFGSPSDTLIHLAASKGSVSALRWLTNNGLSVNVTNLNKMTPLHAAASQNQYQAAVALLELDVCLNCRNIFGHTPLYCAQVMNHKDIADLLISKGGVIL